jgi:hypothetical protein
MGSRRVWQPVPDAGVDVRESGAAGRSRMHVFSKNADGILPRLDGVRTPGFACLVGRGRV